VHSAYAKLGPESSATIHVARYLAPEDGTDPRETECELEDLLELMQPGWRDLLCQRRYLPRMTVAHHLPTAEGGGLRGRADVAVAGVANLYLAGDWVGDEGMLADASLASAKRAGLLAGGVRPLSAAA
jgi:hypothetical protein